MCRDNDCLVEEIENTVMFSADDNPQFVDTVIEKIGDWTLKGVPFLFKPLQQPPGLAADLLALRPEIFADRTFSSLRFIEFKLVIH